MRMHKTLMHGTVAQVKRYCHGMSTTKNCRIDGCTRKAKMTGTLCRPHFYEIKGVPKENPAKRACRIPDCPKRANSAGSLCRTHYNELKVQATDTYNPFECVRAGCANLATRTGGFCPPHYYEAQGLEQPKRNMSRCRIEGCTRPITAAGELCRLHYFEEHGIERVGVNERICSHEGCDNVAKHRGRLCSKHFYEVTGLNPPKRAKRFCRIEGCDRHINSVGSVCRTHYYEINNLPPPGHGIRKPVINVGTCTGPNCQNTQHARNFCRTHYSQWLRRGRVWEIGSRIGRSAMSDCLIRFCENPAARWGYCQDHAVANLGACNVPWCEEPVRHKRLGLCDRHTRQNRTMFHHYGITILERYELSELQDHKCAVCGEPDDKGSLNIDHCHDSGEVRGLLCGNCNRGIGLFAESPANLRMAAKYLERYYG